MRGWLIVFIVLISITAVSAVSNPVTLNSKTYYVVTSTDSTEDTGDEVCTKLGKVCVGYTEKTNAVCKQFHTNAADSTSLSGDESGVYCDGAPQNGVCSTKTNTCHICPTCSVSVQCNQEIGGLYREMYVECINPSASQSCKISITATTVNDFFSQIPSIHAQLQGCPVSIPKGGGLLISNGNTVIDIKMNNLQTKTFTLIVQNGQLTGITTGKSSTCKQTITVFENDFNTILQSSSLGQAAANLFAQKKYSIKGCSFLTSFKLFFVKPIAKIIAKNQAPTLPPPKPAPNCGNVGEQCNNRGCFSGICGAPNENLNGQWGYWNYECIAVSDWAGRCQAYGNTPSPWKCITGPCG